MCLLGQFLKGNFELKNDLSLKLGRPTVFFDRDGTLNEDTHYPHKTEDLYLIPGAAKAVRRFCSEGYLIVVITNQSGIARGFFDISSLNLFNKALSDALLIECARVDLILYCPHHPDITGPCLSRKPLPGLIYEATERLHIDLSKSFFIGDRSSDVACANSAGIEGYLFQGDNLYDFCERSGLFV